MPISIDDFIKVRSEWGNKHKSDEQGLWVITGEDSNADLGGPHSNPFLEIVEGTYYQAVKYAFTLDRFFTWGGGGYVDKYEHPKIRKV